MIVLNLKTKQFETYNGQDKMVDRAIVEIEKALGKPITQIPATITADYIILEEDITPAKKTEITSKL